MQPRCVGIEEMDISRGVTTSNNPDSPWPTVAHGPIFEAYLDELSAWISKFLLQIQLLII